MNFSNIARQLNEDDVARNAEIQSAEKASLSGQKQIDDTQRRREKQKAQMSTQRSTPVKSDVTYASEGYKSPKAERMNDKAHELESKADKLEKTAKNEDDDDKVERLRDRQDNQENEANKAWQDQDQKEYRRERRGTERANRLRGKKKGFTKDISVMSKGMNESRSEREYVKMFSNQSVDWRKDLIEAAEPDAEGNHPYVDVMPFVNQKQNEAKRQEKGAAKVKERMSEALSVQDQMKASREYFKKRNARSPEEKASQEKKDAAGRAKNAAANRNNNIGQFDHSKRND
jgi:hypothetical protein